MEQISSPYQTLYHTNLYLSNLYIQVYNKAMARDHFAQMYAHRSHRHDEPHDSIGFDKAIAGLCGMLYSVVTLKAFFPPRLNSGQSDYEKKITMGQNSSPYQAILPGDQDETHNPL
jgi:hypothetical protein